VFYLTEILGLPVYDSSGAKIGKVRELAAALGAQPPRVKLILLDPLPDHDKSKAPPAVAIEDVAALSTARLRLKILKNEIPSFRPDEGLLLLKKDLLDQQIIDVHGRKVVRVNDLRLEPRAVNQHSELLLWEVDIGLRGALRRLLSGAVPRSWLRKLETHLKTATIPWEVVSLLEADPLRRVKLNISHNLLAKLHPADLADIVEDLPHKERQAIFTALDDVTAAEALSEVDPRMQVSIVESLETSRAADIVEEMPPDAAADLLGDLSEETSSELLEDMNHEDAAEIGELMEFHENSAGGLMTTDYLAIPSQADAHTARSLMISIPDLPENFNTIFLVDESGKLMGSVPLAKLVVAAPDEKLMELRSEPGLSIPSNSPEEEVVELVDKYNLLSLPVVDSQERLIGVVTVDDIISLLRKK
jgi:magnesium transporter